MIEVKQCTNTDWADTGLAKQEFDRLREANPGVHFQIWDGSQLLGVIFDPKVAELMALGAKVAERRKNAVRTEAPVTPELMARFKDPRTIRLLHALIGMCTEVGEAFDQYKRHVFYGKDLDVTNLKEEIGDQDWYVQLFCDIFNVELHDIQEANTAKLKQRFPDKFTEADALNRDLEKEREVLDEHEK